MNHQYKKLLFEKIEKDLYQYSSDEHGIVLKVIQIDNIVNSMIMDMIPNAVFIANVLVKTYIPRRGHILLTRIDKVVCHGLYSNPYHRLKIFVPIIYNPEYRYVKNFASSFLESVNPLVSPKTIHKNDHIELLIKEIRFEKDGYNCLAKIISKNIS